MTFIKHIICVNYFFELIIKGGNRQMVKFIPKNILRRRFIGILKTRNVRITPLDYMTTLGWCPMGQENTIIRIIFLRRTLQVNMLHNRVLALMTLEITKSNRKLLVENRVGLRCFCWTITKYDIGRTCSALFWFPSL